MKQITLSGIRGAGKYALVDDDMYEYLNRWKWHISTSGYAVRWKIYNRENKQMMHMHRIVNNTPNGLLTDHINGNRLDNRRSNLRNATMSQNQFNRSATKVNKSGYKGVYFERRSKVNPWVAYIRKSGKSTNLGCYPTPELASEAYFNAASQQAGEFAK